MWAGTVDGECDNCVTGTKKGEGRSPDAPVTGGCQPKHGPETTSIAGDDALAKHRPTLVLGAAMRNRLARMIWALVFAVCSISSLALLNCEADDSTTPLPPPPDAAKPVSDGGAAG